RRVGRAASVSVRGDLVRARREPRQGALAPSPAQGALEAAGAARRRGSRRGGVMDGAATTGAGARVAIAMATFDPDPELLRRQIDSIRQQTLSDWVCVVSDDRSPASAVSAIREATAEDPRFSLVPSEERRGAYRNFERALERLPASASYVAL